MFEFLDTGDLFDNEIRLRLDQACEAIPEKNYVPAYRFTICLLDGTPIGLCDLRVGHNYNLYVGGNIGYQIDEPYRGHHYAGKAVKLLFSLARKHDLGYLIITCRPDNPASSKTCQWAGGTWLETIPVAQDHEMYEKGNREVMVYRFEL